MAKKEKQIADQRQQLELYEKLKPETFSIAEMSISDIMSAVAVVFQKPYQVMRALLSAYPQNHFQQCMIDAVGMQSEDAQAMVLK